MTVTSAIEKARKDRRLLEIRYPSSKQLKTRVVEPHLMSNIEGTWYLNAYCRRAEAARLFRLERILTARILDEQFQSREGMEMKTEYEDVDPRGYAAKKAVVRFSAEISRWMEERPELDFVRQNEDGSVDYTLYYTDDSWAARRVMQYLGEAVVVEPDELRSEIHRQAASLLQRYEEA